MQNNIKANLNIKDIKSYFKEKVVIINLKSKIDNNNVKKNSNKDNNINISANIVGNKKKKLNKKYRLS